MFRQSVLLVLVASQVFLGTLVASADTTAPATSPEFTLVENVLNLQGQDLSATAAQNQLNGLVSTYLATAQTDGSQQRFQRALIELGVYTPEQARAFVTDAQAASTRVLAAQPVMPAETQSLVSSEMSRLAALNPAGAQFSGQVIGGCVGAVSFAAGVAAVMTGLILRYDNPTCSTQSGTELVCDSNGCHSVTFTRETTCTRPDYYPHAEAGKDTMIAGGIVSGIGALMMVISGHAGC